MVSPLQWLTITLIHSFRSCGDEHQKPGHRQLKCYLALFHTPVLTTEDKRVFEQAQSHHLPSSTAAGTHAWLKRLSLAVGTPSNTPDSFQHHISNVLVCMFYTFKYKIAVLGSCAISACQGCFGVLIQHLRAKSLHPNSEGTQHIHQ